jgi:hypothetical protein
MSDARLVCVAALLIVSPLAPIHAIWGIVILGLSSDPAFWDRIGCVALVKLQDLAIHFRRP